MEMRQRTLELHAAAAAPGGPAGPADPLGELQAAGQHFLKAGRDAVSRALSKGKSEEFLANNRQQGGQ